jgi:hypothetical protein
VVDTDVFPPVRSHAPDPNIFLPYITEDIAFEEEYEEYMSDLGLSDDHTGDGTSPFSGSSAWHRLPLQTDIADNISDSESIVSIGELGDDARLDFTREDGEAVDENLNNWEVRDSSCNWLNNVVTDVFFPAYEPEDYGRLTQVSSG